MKIIRNGVEYELTAAEMRNAYLEVEEGYHIEDIFARAEEMDIDIDENEIYEIVEKVHRALSHNDSYFEAYWMTIEYVLNEYKA